jgi:K+-transporting ATPase ATPase C chain
MLFASLRATALLLLLCCVVYPAAVTAVGQVAFSDAANGSLVRAADGTVVGSAHIGQAFTAPAYLHGRPSAAGAGYDAAASGGSNLAMTSQKLADQRAAEESALREANPNAQGPVPEALLAASGSGLDPEVPPEAARWQVPRIAAARGVAPERVQAIVDELTVGRDLGFLGEPRVNVLAVNLALDRRLPAVR